MVGLKEVKILYRENRDVDRNGQSRCGPADLVRSCPGLIEICLRAMKEHVSMRAHEINIPNSCLQLGGISKLTNVDFF